MATLQARLTALAQALGTDTKTLTGYIGTLASLNTTDKTSLVAAINEVEAALGTIDLSALIDDLAANSVTNKTYSASKIAQLIATAQAELLDASPATLNTLNELAIALANDPNFAATMATSLGNRVRVDAAQTFTGPEKAQARGNIEAASSIDLAALILALGNTDRDLVADYVAAKA